jgi:AcrR family transcriptional regulator
MGVVLNARQRARAAVIADIVAEARRQLADVGPGALSLRSVARELGMASSAIYRYVASRDELLTALIVDAYNTLGEVAEVASETDGTTFQRLKTVCRAVRGWALENPQEYGLLYGSPVPGYQAPQETIGPASRVTLVLARLVLDAHLAGELSYPAGDSLGPAMASEAAHVAGTSLTGLLAGVSLADMPARASRNDVPLATVARALVVWTLLFGQISFEVFGRFDGVVQDAEALFDHTVTIMAELLGLAPK